MRKYLTGVLITALMLVGCLGRQLPDVMYQRWMNMAVPSTVSDLAYGELSEQSGTASYLTYHAVAAYFDLLTRSDSYLKQDAQVMQQRIEFRSCAAIDFQRIFTQAVTDISDLASISCYYGVIGSNAHYIVYDPHTERVYHVIDWIRD